MYFLFVPYMYFILVLGKEWKRILVMLLCVIISFLLFITFFFEEYVIEIFICIIFGVFFFAIGMIYMTVKETSDKVSLLEKTVTLCFEIILMLIALSLSGIIFFFDLNGKNPSFVSFIQENTSIECLWGVFGVFIVCLVIIWPIISNYYNKMVDLAFLYGEKNDKTSQGENNKSRIYIYTRIGNQFLYGDKDRLQYNKKEFDDELRKIKEQIKKKKWDKKVRCEREKAIDRLKPYSVYIEIGEAKKEFNKLNTCIDKCADKEKKGIVKTILEIMPEIIILGLVTITEIIMLIAIVRIVEKVVLKRVVNILLVSILLLVIALVLIITSIKEKRRIFKEQQKCSDKNSSDNIKNKINEIIKTFEEKKPAVKLLPEDELKNYKIYPIIDKERNDFFN